MNINRLPACFAAACFVVTAIAVAGSEAGGEPTERDDGWRPLCNGKDLDGWATTGTAKWRVENGVIIGGQDGDASRRPRRAH